MRPFNAPGLFMAILWIAYLIFIIVGYQNIEVEYKYEKLRKEYHNQDLEGHSIEVSSSTESSPLTETPTSTTTYRWYFLEEALQKELPHSKVTWKTYCDGENVNHQNIPHLFFVVSIQNSFMTTRLCYSVRHSFCFLAKWELRWLTNVIIGNINLTAHNFKDNHSPLDVCVVWLFQLWNKLCVYGI